MKRLVLLSFTLLTQPVLCGCASSEGDAGRATTATWTGGGSADGGAGGQGGVDATGGGGSGAAGGGGAMGTCIHADGMTAGSDSYSDAPFAASVTIDARDSCTRTYTLDSDQPRVDDLPASPRLVSERADAPVVRTGHDMFDALYALALEEVRELSVDNISNFAFNGGAPVPCPVGGCFETGRKWTYVWTRDTAYAVMLSLGMIDPLRAKNSLAYKLSERRGGGDVQIVQDTGSGGSYPVSTDRVVWALGAWELLKYLDGAERDEFRDLAYDALRNTAEHDRAVVFDDSDGLYTGEQSFLDWREQSYPEWVAQNTVHIGMSKTLSTNVGHLRLLEITAALATEKGLSGEASQYQAWADSLRTAIDVHFWLDGEQQLSTLSTTFLDPSPTRRFDLLGASLALLADVGTPAKRSAIVAGYPHLQKGAPVMWPQQQFVPIYHNRGIWPFVTALWLKAAHRTGNDAAIENGVHALMRGAALNLSNMENFEMVSGAPWLDDGNASGPVVNSQRQLWSVAGYISMVHDVIFGLDVSQDGIRFVPRIPAALADGMFADKIALSNLPYRGGRVSVTIEFGDTPETRLNGAVIGSEYASNLTGEDLFEITLPASSDGAIRLLSDTSDYRELYSPRTPSINSVAIDGTSLGVAIDIAGEDPNEVTIDVIRDGVTLASDLPGSTSYFLDPTTEPHCYAIELAFVSSGTRSQHSEPFCHWGGVYVIDAQSFVASGGTLVFNHGKWHHEGWGDPGHTLSASFTAPTSGRYYLQLDAGNGAGPFDTGITCAVKRVEVSDQNGVVGSDYLMMPHLATWSAWRDSSFMAVDLVAGTTYSILIGEDAQAINMSEREHFAIYDNTGGSGGRFNRVNIAAIKLLAAGN